mmetsp:Transcript_87082/g.154066  ORF Transcript_87082/g.154066 Transcript_87082/m.154066 type:complete len:237 (+) Transcript_87082:838-1548(+)
MAETVVPIFVKESKNGRNLLFWISDLFCDLPCGAGEIVELLDLSLELSRSCIVRQAPTSFCLCANARMALVNHVPSGACRVWEVTIAEETCTLFVALLPQVFEQALQVCAVLSVRHIEVVGPPHVVQVLVQRGEVLTIEQALSRREWDDVCLHISSIIRCWRNRICASTRIACFSGIAAFSAGLASLKVGGALIGTSVGSSTLTQLLFPGFDCDGLQPCQLALRVVNMPLRLAMCS